MSSLYWKLTSSFLKFFFRMLYGPFAWSYDLVAAVVSMGRWQAWVLSPLPYLPGPRVLELGFGPGHLLRALAELDIWVVGLDASRQMAVMNSVRGRRKNRKQYIINGYAQFIPFCNLSFHQVVATFPTEYIWEQQTLNEIYRVLTPGGTLVLLPVAWINGHGIIDRLARLLFELTGQAPPLGDNSLVEHSQSVLESVGFHVQVDRQDLATSSVLLVRGRKPG